MIVKEYFTDQRVLDELVPWKREVDVFAKQTVASTNVVLRSKRGEENNLGNLVTDSMVDHVSGEGAFQNESF